MTSSRQVNFRCPEDKLVLFEAAAERAGKTLTAWLIGVGMAACDETEDLEQLLRVYVRAKKATRTR